MGYKMGRKTRQIFRYQELGFVTVFQEVQKLSVTDCTSIVPFTLKL